jgi:hypothetical protein
MLLPGAVYVILLVAGLLGVALCMLLASLVGAAACHVSEFLIQRTKAWQLHRRGNKGTDRWWFDFKAWTTAFTFASFVVFIYTFAGPYATFIKYLKGV